MAKITDVDMGILICLYHSMKWDDPGKYPPIMTMRAIGSELAVYTKDSRERSGSAVHQHMPKLLKRGFVQRVGRNEFSSHYIITKKGVEYVESIQPS